jgi:hypothetical protein
MGCAILMQIAVGTLCVNEVVEVPYKSRQVQGKLCTMSGEMQDFGTASIVLLDTRSLSCKSTIGSVLLVPSCATTGSGSLWCYSNAGLVAGCISAQILSTGSFEYASWRIPGDVSLYRSCLP